MRRMGTEDLMLLRVGLLKSIHGERGSEGEVSEAGDAGSVEQSRS